MIFVTGGTGYLGTALVARLLERGHAVRALVRPGSEGKLVPGAEPLIGDALRPATWAAGIWPCRTLVHLIGTSHPAPWKARQFLEVDLASVTAMLAAARGAGIEHVVYVSVAQPAPVMWAYVAARAEAERRIRASGIPATILRPWYVLGPGHCWPIVLRPAYALLERLPATAATARRLALTRLPDMVDALVAAVEGSGFRSDRQRCPSEGASASEAPLPRAPSESWSEGERDRTATARAFPSGGHRCPDRTEPTVGYRLRSRNRRAIPSTSSDHTKMPAPTCTPRHRK